MPDTATMEENAPTTYKAYSRRWIYLIVAIAINFSNGNTWITFASVTFYTNDFYNQANATTFLNAIFMVLSIPVGVLAMWWTDKYGLRSAFHIGIWSNLIGNIIRFVGSGSWMSTDLRFPLVFAGQTIAAFAQPFVLFLPTKLAAFWFKENERALANTLVSMSNPLGIALMYSMAPLVVNKHHPAAFAELTGICLFGAVITAFLSFFVTASKPPTPVAPSKSVDVIPPPFGQGFLRCLKSKRFMTLAFTLGGGVGAFSALYNNLQPALCSRGYSASFNGVMGAALIFAGLIGAAVSGIIVDKTGKFEGVMKFCFGFAGLAAASLAISINFENQPVWIALSISMFGVFAFAIYPIGLEAGVEATYPVAEATSTGIIVLIGQIEGVIFVLVTTLVAQSPTPHMLGIQTCVDDNGNISTVLDWRNSFLAWLGIISFLILIFLIFFRPRNRRRLYEKQQMERLVEQDVNDLKM